MASNNPLDKLTLNQRLALAAMILVVAGIVAYFSSRKQQEPAPAPTPDQTQAPPPHTPGEQGKTLKNRNVRFGTPADAKHDPASKDAYLMERDQYVLSYNDSKKIPNWVCWNLTKSDIGKTDRSAFAVDPDLPDGFRKIKHADYDGSGFDRGHMCPSKDRSDTEENNKIAFFMTNIVPQAPNNNQKAWKNLEEKCRRIAEEGKELYVASGPHGQGGVGRDNTRHTHVGKGVQIEVPEAVWKVVLVLPGKDDLPTQNSRTIAVWMPNDQSIGDDWKPYIVSVSDVEKRTGCRFFPLVPDNVANPIKSQVDRGQ